MRGLVMRDAHEAYPLFLFPCSQQRHDHVRVHEAVTLHEVDLLAPQAIQGLLEAALCVRRVGKELAGGPYLVGVEDLVPDVERAGEIANACLGTSVEWGRVDETPPGFPERAHHRAQVISRLARQPVESHEGAEADGRELQPCCAGRAEDGAGVGRAEDGAGVGRAEDGATIGPRMRHTSGRGSAGHRLQESSSFHHRIVSMSLASKARMQHRHDSGPRRGICVRSCRITRSYPDVTTGGEP